MSLPVHSYLRTHRRKWALTQKDLAFLLGQKSPAHISRLEQGKRMPGAEVVLACEILFGITPRSVFPLLYQGVEKAVLTRAKKLCATLEHKTNYVAMRKKEFLSAVLKGEVSKLAEAERI